MREQLVSKWKINMIKLIRNQKVNCKKKVQQLTLGSWNSVFFCLTDSNPPRPVETIAWFYTTKSRSWISYAVLLTKSLPVGLHRVLQKLRERSQNKLFKKTLFSIIIIQHNMA